MNKKNRKNKCEDRNKQKYIGYFQKRDVASCVSQIIVNMEGLTLNYLKN